MKKLLHLLKNPSPHLLIFVYIITLLSCVGSVLILAVDFTKPPLSFLAYSLFALAFLSLSFTVYTLVYHRKRIKSSFAKLINKSTLAKKLVSSFGFRAVTSSFIGFSFNIIYGIINGVLGIMSASLWYGALCPYYIVLSFIYGKLVLHHTKSKEDKLGDIRAYRSTGVLLLILNIFLSAAIVQMIFSNQSFKYSGLMIYVSATYAFYKITMAIINFVKGRHYEKMSLRAILNINLTQGAVSILALQTALLSTFGDESIDMSLFNTLTGSVVSLLSLGIGIFMIIKGNKSVKQEKANER